MSVSVSSVYMYVCPAAHVYLVPMEVRRDVLDLLELLRDSCEGLCGYWELNHCPLEKQEVQEQAVLLSTELSISAAQRVVF